MPTSSDAHFQGDSHKAADIHLHKPLEEVVLLQMQREEHLDSNHYWPLDVQCMQAGFEAEAEGTAF